ncbi:MAG: hypothetical protein GVY36_09850 [Verrucomicrobia bacterium]|jgi:hypothetical protein|nr:hypothetical protein [Verrucomicrobiota bacterium]
MFHRKNRKRFDGEIYEYWTLCESVRTERGPHWRISVASRSNRSTTTALAEKENWTDVQNGVEARLVEHPDRDGKERFVLCRSNAWAAKERAMLERQMNRLSDELIKVNRSLRKRPGQDEGKIERRIGRWLGKYPAAAKWIKAELVDDRQGRACALRLYCPLPDRGHPLLVKEAYLLRTVAKPDPGVALLLAHLGLHLPKGPKIVQNVVEKNR